MKGYCTMLSIGNYGRFANLLFQVCGVLGVARKNGLTPAFKQLRNLDHLERFGSKEDIDIYKYFENELPNLPINISWIDKPIQWGYNDVILGSGDWNISGHFQSFKYFEHCADEARFYLRMKGEKKYDTCAIHYRAGDYQHGQQSYHPRMPIEYYAMACENFSSDQKYLIFSDDKNEAEKICKDLRIKYDVSNGKDYIEDFRIMKSCSEFIICNSSYSALAAWLSGSVKVISPSGYNWFGDIAKINGNDIVHDSWHQIRFDKNKQYKSIA